MLYCPRCFPKVGCSVPMLDHETQYGNCTQCGQTTNVAVCKLGHVADSGLNNLIPDQVEVQYLDSNHLNQTVMMDPEQAAFFHVLNRISVSLDILIDIQRQRTQ